jgi:hypothetical protein
MENLSGNVQNILRKDVTLHIAGWCKVVQETFSSAFSKKIFAFAISPIQKPIGQSLFMNLYQTKK